MMMKFYEISTINIANTPPTVSFLWEAANRIHFKSPFKASWEYLQDESQSLREDLAKYMKQDIHPGKPT